MVIKIIHIIKNKLMNFNKKYRLLLILCVSIIVNGCKEDFDINFGTGEFELSIKEIIEDASAFQDKKFGIDASALTQWRITNVGEEDWILIDLFEGKGNDTIKYSMPENFSAETRSGKLLFEAFLNGEIFYSNEVSVNQMSQNAYLVVDNNQTPTFGLFSQFEKADNQVYVKGNVEWVVNVYKGESGTEIADWIEISQNTGLNHGGFVFTVKQNMVEADRSARIVISAKDDSSVMSEILISQSKKEDITIENLVIVVKGMSGFIPDGSGTLTIKPVSGLRTNITMPASVTIVGSDTKFTLNDPILATRYTLVSYDATAGLAYNLGVDIFIEYESTIEVTTWDNDFKQFGGTKESPLLISDAAGLKKLQEVVDGGKSYSGKYLKMSGDIDLSAYDNWAPIGKLASASFKGNFDGDNKTITGLKITASSADRNGLFGVVEGVSADNIASVKNVKMVSSNSGFDIVATHACNGAIAGSIRNNVIIENCHSSLKMKVGANSGGIIGAMSYTNNTPGPALPAPTTEKQNIIIRNCHNSGEITFEGTANYNGGGIVGINTGEVIGCSNTGALIKGTKTKTVLKSGGIVGVNLATVKECYNTGNIAVGNNSGGIAGLCGNSRLSIIKDCYNTGNISNGNNLGGIVANTTGTTALDIINCYNTGTLTATVKGGIIGVINVKAIMSIRFCVSTQAAIGNANSNTYAGDADTGDPITVPTDRVKMTNLAGMKNVSTFTTGYTLPSTWNFTDVWKIDEGSTTPYLKNNQANPLPN